MIIIKYQINDEGNRKLMNKTDFERVVVSYVS